MALLQSHVDCSRFRRISSAPSIQMCASAEQQSKDCGGQLEFYIHCRQFSSWCGGIMHKIPKPCARVLKESGVGHFLLVVKTNGGQLHSFDFGPVGGEITLKMDQVKEERLGLQPRTRLGAQGEIREEVLSEMPADAMYIGSTSTWTLEDIRIHNSQQPTVYKLHENDCRHYVNRLVHKVTGVDLATVSLLEHNHEERTKVERAAWLAGIKRASSSGSSGSGMSASSSTGSMNTEQGSSSASHADSADENLQRQSEPIDVTASLPGMHGLSPAAMTFMLPILANAPAWDTPLVMLGRVLSHPHHWPAVQAAGQGVAFASAVGVMRAAAFAAQPHITALATTAAAASSGTPVAVAGSKASLLISRTAQTLAGTVSARIPYLAPVAKAIAATLKTKAAQIAAPVAYVAQSSMRGRKNATDDSALVTTSMSSTTSNGHNVPSTPRARLDRNSTGSIAEHVKGGLTPLPARSPQKAVSTEQASRPAGLPLSILAAPRTKTASSEVGHDTSVEEIAPAKPVGIFARWFWYSRRTRAGPKKQEPVHEPESASRPLSRVPTAARLSAAHIQAAVTPEGPSSNIVMPRKRLLASLIRFRPLRRAAAAAANDGNAYVNTDFTMPANEPRRFFSLPAWFSMRGFRNTTLVVPAAVVAHTAGPASGMAERRWWFFPVPHPLPTLATTSISSSEDGHHSHYARDHAITNRLDVQPLEQDSVSFNTSAPLQVSFLPNWLSFKRASNPDRYAITASTSIMDGSVSSEHDQETATAETGIVDQSDDFDDFQLPQPPMQFSGACSLVTAPSKPITCAAGEDFSVAAAAPTRPMFAVRTLSMPSFSFKQPATPASTPVRGEAREPTSTQVPVSSFALVANAVTAGSCLSDTNSGASGCDHGHVATRSTEQPCSEAIAERRWSLGSAKSGEFPHMPVLPPAKASKPRRFLFKLNDHTADQAVTKRSARYRNSRSSGGLAGLFLAKDQPTASKSLASVGALVIGSVMQEKWSLVQQVVV